MNASCHEFRQRIGAEPGSRDPALLQHRLECRTCAEFHRNQERLDAGLASAMHIPVPEQLPARIHWRVSAASHSGWAVARQRVAMAASLLLALGVGFGVWTASAPVALGGEVVAHLQHEPELLLSSGQRASAQKVSAVMGRAGFGLRRPLEDVSHAGLCPFRGRLVPHLVLEVDGEPVSVLLLKNEKLRDVEQVDEDGFHGLLLPTPYGAMAVVAPRAELVQPVRLKLEQSVGTGI